MKMLLTLSICLVLCGLNAAAQDTGNLSGDVVAVTGGSIPNAALTVTELDSGYSVEGLSSTTGSFQFNALPSGIYRVEAEAPGYKRHVVTDIAVSSVRPTEITLTLEKGNPSETVRMTAEASLLDTTSGQIAMGLSATQVRELPITDRNYQELIGLYPGISLPDAELPLLLKPQRDRIFATNGQSFEAASWKIDGFSNREPFTNTSIFISPVQSIQEVKVATSSYSADSGRAGASVVNVNTRSGGTEFHGDLFWFNSVDELRNRDFFETEAVEEGEFLWNQFGGSIGGPIPTMRDKLFFFGTYEGTYMDYQRPRFASVPTQAMRQGDFQNIPSVNLYDPRTGLEDGTGRQPFPGNQIPAGSFSSVTSELLSLYPNPNKPGLENNLLQNAPVRTDTQRTGGRMDFRPADNTAIFLNYRYGRYFVSDESPLGLVLGGGAEARLRTHNAYAGISHSFMPDLVTQIRLGYNRYRNRMNTLNAPNPLFGSGYENFDGTELPRIRFSGLTDIGAREGLPLRGVDNTYQIANNWSWTHRKHNLQFGWDANFLRTDGLRGFGFTPSRFGIHPGRVFDFGLGVTALPSSPMAQNRAAGEFASFLLGMPTVSTDTEQLLSPSYRRTQYMAFASDTIRLTPRLTLNLGVRWELISPVTPANDGGLSNFNPLTNAATLPPSDTFNERPDVDWNTTNFGPRVGVAFKLTDKAVLRGGYALSHFPETIAFAGGGLFPALVSSQRGLPGSFQAAGTLTDPQSPATTVPPVREANGTEMLTLTPPVDQPLVSMAQDRKTPRVHSYNVTLEHDWGEGIMTSLAYVGSLGRQLPYLREFNAARPGAGLAGLPLLEFGRTASTIVSATGANSNYNAFQANVRKRFSKGLSFTASYTYGRALDQVTGQGFLIGNFSRDRNYGRSDFDREHIFTASHVWEIPLGKGTSHLNYGVIGAIVSNWQLQGNMQWFSGRPFTPVADPLFCNCPGNTQTFADIRGPVTTADSTPGDIGDGLFFDTTNIGLPPADSFGDAGRNSIQGPGFFNYDMSVFRGFDVTESHHLEFRAEFFNLFNTTQFATPVSSVNSPNFGRIVESRATSSQAEQFGSARQVNFGLRLTF